MKTKTAEAGESSDHRPRLAFTLTELVLVVAMLVVFATLVMAGTASDREKARRLGCRNNLRQMGIGSHSYATNYLEMKAGSRPEQQFSRFVSGLWAASLCLPIGIRPLKQACAPWQPG